MFEFKKYTGSEKFKILKLKIDGKYVIKGWKWSKIYG